VHRAAEWIAHLTRTSGSASMTTNLSARTWPLWARTGDEWRPRSSRPVRYRSAMKSPTAVRPVDAPAPVSCPHTSSDSRGRSSPRRSQGTATRGVESWRPVPQSSQSEVAPAGRGGRGPISAPRARAVISHSPRLNHGQTMRVHTGYTRGSTTAPTKPTWPTVESPVSQRFQQRPTTALHGSVRPLKAVARVRIPSGYDPKWPV